MKKAKSNFNIDIDNEEIITNWIHSHILIEPKYIFIKSDSLELQHKGIDGYLISEEIFGDKEKHSIDLKNASNYIQINQDATQLPTFAFELDYYKDSMLCDGWLYGDKYNDVEYYLISWLWADKHPPKDSYHKKKGILHPSQIKDAKFTKAHILIIKKSKIKEYAENYRINKNNYNKITNYMRKRYISHLSTASNPNDFHSLSTSLGNSKYPRLFYSASLHEKPVNLVISLHTLKSLALYSETYDIYE